MPRDRYSYAASAAHGKPATHRAVVALLVVISIALLVLARVSHPAIAQLRLQMLDLLEPVMGAISQPISATRTLARSTQSVLETAEENRQLKAENETLRHWQSVAQALKAENRSLRGLMAYKPVETASYVTARVVGQSPGTFGQFLTINAGADQGVKKMQPVVDAFGLIGRTLEVAHQATRVMVLSDVGSRVPVITGSSRHRAILAGTGGDLLRLSFLNGDATLALGEPVVTTQEGALIPGGIAIGHVLTRDDAGYLVKPVRPLTQSEYVRVIQSSAADLPPAP